MKTKHDEVYRQSIDMDINKFWCKSCKHYGGAHHCKRHVLIAFVNTDTPECIYYEYGKKCPHCGQPC